MAFPAFSSLHAAAGPQLQRAGDALAVWFHYGKSAPVTNCHRRFFGDKLSLNRKTGLVGFFSRRNQQLSERGNTCLSILVCVAQLCKNVEHENALHYGDMACQKWHFQRVIRDNLSGIVIKFQGMTNCHDLPPMTICQDLSRVQASGIITNSIRLYAIQNQLYKTKCGRDKGFAALRSDSAIA